MDYCFELETGHRPSERVIDSIAAVTGKSPLELHPLGNVIDVDALDALLAEERPGSTTEVEFRYAGWIITVTTERIQINVPGATQTQSDR